MPNGPYETEADALAGPLAREIRALHASGRVRSGDPDHLVSGTQYDYLMAACAAAGVELGAWDRRVLAWLANWEPAMVQVLCGLITRAADSQ
jgi:hypothetical protein